MGPRWRICQCRLKLRLRSIAAPCKSTAGPFNKLSRTLVKTCSSTDLRASSLTTEKSSNYDYNSVRWLTASDLKLCYLTLRSWVQERAVTAVGKFFWDRLHRGIRAVEECHYFAFFLGFKLSIRDKMGKLVTLSAPCRQHIPACSSRAWRRWAVGLGGPQAPRDHASRVGHLAGPNRRGQRCHLPRCGARPQLLTDNKAVPACRKDREDLPIHPWASLDGLPATHWEHGLYDRCCHRARGTTELTKKPVRSLCSPAQRSRSSFKTHSDLGSSDLTPQWGAHMKSIPNLHL